MKYFTGLLLTLTVMLTACGTKAPDVPLFNENQDVTGVPQPTTTPPPTTQPPVVSGELGQIADTLINNYAEDGLSGVFLLTYQGETILRKAYGKANQETGVLNTPETVFVIGSIAKDFTKLGILLLAQEGLLELSDTIDQYFDNLPEDKQVITVEQLLDHTAGLAEYHDVSGDFDYMSRDEAIETIWNAPLIAEPGTQDAYSNSGYTLLALLIEEISGQDYTEFIRTRIFQPLGLTRTGFWGDSFDNMAYSANEFDTYGVSSEWAFSWSLVGNGGLVSTVDDLQRFILAVYHNELVESRSAFHLDDPFLGAGGSDQHEYNAVVGYVPELDMMVVGLTNTREPIEAEFAVQEVLVHMLKEGLIEIAGVDAQDLEPEDE